DVLSPEDTRPASVLRSLRRGDKVISEIFWRNWCSARGYESPPGPTVLAVSLPRGGGSLRLGLTGDSPRCDLPGRPSYLGVGPFVAPIPEPLPSSHLPLAVEIIGAPAGKEPKAVARRGTAFHYRLALRNTSRRPFRFESCPTYEELWVDGS